MDIEGQLKESSQEERFDIFWHWTSRIMQYTKLRLAGKSRKAAAIEVIDIFIIFIYFGSKYIIGRCDRKFL